MKSGAAAGSLSRVYVKSLSDEPSQVIDCASMPPEASMPMPIGCLPPMPR